MGIGLENVGELDDGEEMTQIKKEKKERKTRVETKKRNHK
jgi:hypothetical protein